MNLIAAMGMNMEIGYKNDLPWKLPADLRRVRKLTTGNTIVMGRKNFESIGRPLPNRRNIILTRNKKYSQDGCDVFHTVQEVLDATKDDTVFIFGGSEIYELFLPYVNTMYLTFIMHEFPGDTFFPHINWSEWHREEVSVGYPDKENDYQYYFITLGRKQNTHQDQTQDFL